MLIQINAYTIVNSEHILKAERIGNYTEILVKGQQPWQQYSIWDDTQELWNKVLEATK